MSLLDLVRSNRDRSRRNELKHQSELTSLNTKIREVDCDLTRAKTPSKVKSLQGKRKRYASKARRVGNSRDSAAKKVARYDTKIVRLESNELSGMSTRLAGIEQRLREEVRSELAAEFADRQYDVFLCHDDRDEVLAIEFDRMLTEAGLDVWFDDRVVKRGMSLANQIDTGLARSHIGVILLTPRFFDGGYWRHSEKGALLSSRKRIYPVRHDMTYEQLLTESPLLADRVGDSTTGARTFGEIALEIAEIVEEVKAERMGAAEPEKDSTDEE